MIGKWQLFNNRFESVEGALRADAGFDSFLVWQLRNEERGSRYWGPLFNHNGELHQHPDNVFGPDLLNDHVLDFIGQHAAEPFLIYYPMLLTHDPWVTTPDMRDENAGDQQKFAAMMAYMDKMVGNVRRKVEETGLVDRTLILFIGDNGTGREIASRYRGRDVRGAKGKTIAAGSRVPFIACCCGGAADELPDVSLDDWAAWWQCMRPAAIAMPSGRHSIVATSTPLRAIACWFDSTC